MSTTTLAPVAQDPVEESARRAPLLDVRGLTVSYGRKTVVHDVAFSLYPGRTLALIGESGSGKSTIARAVLRLLPNRRAHVDGAIDLRGDDTTVLSDRAFRPLRGRVLGFVPQDPANSLNPVRTVGSQALEATRTVPGTRQRASQRSLVLRALERVGLPDPERVFSSFPHQLSGGQLQRVLIAMAIIPDPAVIIADEPTSALDATVQHQILDLLDQLQRDLGIGMLLITHDLALAAERADDVIVLQNGRIQESGPRERVFSDPESEYTRELQADVPGLNPDRFAADRRARDEAYPVTEAPARVELRGVSRTFLTRDHAVKALDDVSFSIPRGRTHALVGESGSGKSTAARILLGLERPDAGELLIDGRTVDVEDPHALRAMRRNLQIVYQNPFTSLNPRFTVERIVREPLDLYRAGEAADRAEWVRWALDAVRLPPEVFGRRASELSGGQRQRVAIARSLVLRPDTLVLDEPTSALDVTVQAGILEVLQDLQRELGLTYLFISHDLAVVRQFADTMTVLQRGSVMEAGSTAEIFSSPEHEYTHRLISSVPASDAGEEGTDTQHEGAIATDTASDITWIHTDWGDPRSTSLYQDMADEVGPRYAEHRKPGRSPVDPVPENVVDVVLALIDGRPVATGALHRLPDRWELKRLFVAPGYRGRKLARKVLARIEQGVRERGGTEIFLQTGNRQPDAIALYESEGWERVEVFSPYDPDDGISVCFRKVL